MDADLASLQIDLCSGADNGAFLQVEDAVLCERLERLARPGVELHEPVTGGHEDDPVVAFAVGPDRDASTSYPSGQPCSVAIRRSSCSEKLGFPPVPPFSASPRRAPR